MEACKLPFRVKNNELDEIHGNVLTVVVGDVPIKVMFTGSEKKNNDCMYLSTQNINVKMKTLL